MTAAVAPLAGVEIEPGAPDALVVVFVHIFNVIVLGNGLL